MAVASMRHEPAPQYPSIKPGMMGMYIFLASEVMFFGSLFAVYFYLVGSHPTWPPIPPSNRPEYYVNWWPIPFFNTIILASSGVTCHFALGDLANDRRRRFFFLWIATIVLGALFEFFQAYEFIQAFARGLTLKANSFASAFFITASICGRRSGRAAVSSGGGSLTWAKITRRSLSRENGGFPARHSKRTQPSE